MNGNSDFFNLKVEQNDFKALLEDRRKEKELTDVQLQIGDKLFDAHRVILSLYSPVLRAMISEHWSTTKICPISEEYVDVDIVDDLLTFLYTGSIKLTPDNVHSVCMVAQFLQISMLLEPSVKYLCLLINIDNVLKLFSFSNACQLELLNERCSQFIFDNWEKVLQSDSILELSFKDFKDFVVELRTRYVGTVLRENTFHCIVRWTEKNLSERSEHLPNLLKNISLVELSPTFIAETVFVHPLVKNSISCQETISKALANEQTFKNYNLQRKQNMIVIGNQKSNNERFLSCYDSSTGVWRKLPKMLSPRFCSVATVVNQQDIIITGEMVDVTHLEFETDSSVEMFNWKKQICTKLPEMPMNLKGLSIVVHKSRLYAAGDHKNESKILRYFFETKQWQEIIPYVERSSLSYGKLISYKDYIYFIRGIKTTISIIKYDPAIDITTKLAPLTGFKEQFAATLHQDKIYISSNNNFAVYNPENNDVTYLPAIGNFKSLLSMNGKLLAVGCRFGDKQETKNSIYELDISDHIPFGVEIEFDKMNIGEDFNFDAALVGEFH